MVSHLLEQIVAPSVMSTGSQIKLPNLEIEGRIIMIVKVRQINTGEFLTVQGVLLAIQSDLSSGLEGANDKRAIQEFSINDIVYIISMNSAFEIIEIKPESLESGMINARSELISKIPNEVTFKNDPNLGTKINEFLNKEGLF